MYEMLWYFMIYSVIGWMIEVSFQAVTRGEVINRGFLNGPLCPVYGSGVIMVLMVVDLCGFWFGLETNLSEASTIELFIIGIIFATLIELVAGFLLDQLFHARWWDYRDRRFNLNGYICLEFSIIWGLAIAFVLRVIQPVFEGIVATIPEKIGIIILIVCYFVFTIDIIITVLTVLKLNKQLSKMRDMELAIQKLSDGMSEIIGNSTLKTVEKINDSHDKVEQRKAELRDKMDDAKADLEESYKHLRLLIRYQRIFGMGRVIKSLSKRGNKMYQDILDKLRNAD
jgi:Predicted membrane protein